MAFQMQGQAPAHVVLDRLGRLPVRCPQHELQDQHSADAHGGPRRPAVVRAVQQRQAPTVGRQQREYRSGKEHQEAGPAVHRLRNPAGLFEKCQQLGFRLGRRSPAGT
jgi:hypothetical protein